MWEQPLGVIAGIMEEPGEGFVDPYEAEERAAIQWESTGNVSKNGS